MKDSYKNDRPLYNSRIIDTYIKLVKRNYNHVNISELLDHANMKSYEVADQGHWFTQEQVNRFQEKLVKETGNSNIAQEAGRFTASPDAIGAMRQYVLGLVGPAKAYEFIGRASSNFTRSTTYESKRIASNKIEIKVTPKEGVVEEPFQCENRIGFFQAISLGFNNKFPKIEHPECIFKEGDSCHYIISWKKTLSTLLKRIRGYTALTLPICMLMTFIFMPSMVRELFAPFLMTFVLIITLLTLIQSRVENTEVRGVLEKFHDSTNQLINQIDLNYNNARVTNEIGQVISKQTNIEDILDKVCQVSENRLDYDRGLILLANKDKTRLEIRTGFGYSVDMLEIMNKTFFHLDKPDSKGVFVVSFKEQKPFLVNDINEIQDNLSLRSLAFAKKAGTQSFICCPIVCDGDSIGVLAVDNLKTKRPLVQSDMSLLMGISSVVGISIRNAELFDSMTKQFSSLLQVMAASIDARDPLTAGHSENVTKYAMGICQELGLSKDYTEVVRVAASLHDYGKIGIPDALLKKPGRLTDQEYEIIKTHATQTKTILAQVNFEGMFIDVPEIAGSHHEKIDGSGYPNGLKRKEIPYGAQIISVADFFEAITAKRHYRAPMPLDKAFALLYEEKGVHFEEKIVDAFTRYYVKTNPDKKMRLVS
jgi:HD-GYP domain-containing protein (c-di-GMP phosphodiesterase class II)